MTLLSFALTTGNLQVCILGQSLALNWAKVNLFGRYLMAETFAGNAVLTWTGLLVKRRVSWRVKPRVYRSRMFGTVRNGDYLL